jgi:hypothetical protein
MQKGNPLEKTLLKPSEEASDHFKIPLLTIYPSYQMGNIDGINISGRCLRIFSKSLQEFLGSTSVPSLPSHREKGGRTASSTIQNQRRKKNEYRGES